MADKRFRGRDKIVQKMTKDGLVEENLRTGETKSAVAEEPPKQEDSEKDAVESAEETPVVEEEVCTIHAIVNARRPSTIPFRL